MLMLLFKFIMLALIAGECIASALHYFDTAGAAAGAKVPKPREYLEAGLSNFLAVLATLVLLPWAFSAQRMRKFDPGGGPPICLVTTSFWGWGSALFGLHKNLKARGARNVYLLPLAFSRGAIDRMSDVLTQEIEKLSGQIGGHKPYLVAHGVAGLAARMGPSKSPGQWTQGTMTVATPHHGTRLAVFMPGQLGFQLKPGSPLLQTLAPEAGDCLLTFHSPTDTQIIPSQSALFGQSVRSLSACGHLSILWSASLADQILSEITAKPSP